MGSTSLFMTIEYISEMNMRKDYVDSFAKYEHELQVPYYMNFRPTTQDLRLYRHSDGRYVKIETNLAGRLVELSAAANAANLRLLRCAYGVPRRLVAITTSLSGATVS